MNAHLVPQPMPAPNLKPMRESQRAKRDAKSSLPSTPTLAEVNHVIAKLRRVDGALLVKELAAMLRVNKATVYRWTTRQHDPLPHVRIGGVVRLDGTWTADWLKRQVFR
jgi:Helix-turn-helix domain